MKKTRIITVTAMLAAMAFLLQLLGSVIGVKIGGFLDVEISDLPAIIGSLALGPLCGVLIELIKNILHCSVSSTGCIGELANFLVNGTFVLTLGLMYRRHKTKKRAMLGFALAIVLYSAVGIIANLLLLLPLYMPEADINAKLGIVLGIITPFNLVKGALLSVITLLIYKKISPILKSSIR